MTISSQPKGLLLAFLLTAGAALCFAVYTNHAWEDYYITYRTSKNLATGHGLVFNPGDRLHTFTSPLGVLLPAVALLLTGNSSDVAALWIFRVMCILALGGAAALLVAFARRLAYPAVIAAFLVVLLATDAKSLDFTINGMETAFMLLFIAYALWAHFSPGPRQWLHLGTAWAGLMWTRPDSFIYIGLVAGGIWICNDPARTGCNRRELFARFIRAGLLTMALYGPWLAWATWYYGTPVPHTIIAKGAQSNEGEALLRVAHGVWRLPYLIWKGQTAAEGAFLPAYFMFPEWPAWMLPFGRGLATICALLWLVPRVRLEARVASLTYFASMTYLSFVPYFPFPWYYPTATLLAFVALAGTAAPLWQTGRPLLRYPLALLGTAMVAGAVMLTLGVARQARAQQHYIENETRRPIGEWLHAHAAPGDSVFMEPLGYIGFYSGLKTYDWPGMSSREVPDACRLVGTNWGDLIRFLQPTWLVLRANGEGDLPHIDHFLADTIYDRVRDFDQSEAVRKIDVPGRRWLEFDSHFVLYHLRRPMRHDADGYRIATLFPPNVTPMESVNVRMVHAPGTLVAAVPAGAGAVDLKFGFPAAAAEGPEATDGAIFQVWLADGNRRTKLHERLLNPVADEHDRGLQHLTLTLPARRHPADTWLVLETKPNRNMNKDWTYWADPAFK